LQGDSVGAVGFEHPSDYTGNPLIGDKSGTDSGTLAPAPAPSLPPDLAELLNAWPTLPPAIKAGIAAMIGAATIPKGDA
jgi:hypothetical protein